jgi:uncharacterized LabA/DUF88 family protein
MTSPKMKNLRVGVFIDGSNIFWGSKKSGIKIDFEKLKEYLNKYFSPIMFNYYGCEDNKPNGEKYVKSAKEQKKFHQNLESFGYKVIRKDLKHMACGVVKCDMDIELTMDLRKHEDDIDCIILLTGDSDYLSVIEYYWKSGKYIRIFSFKELLSWELKAFTINHSRCNYKLINEIKGKIERF